MISILIPRKTVIKKIVLLKKLLVFQGKSSEKETGGFMCRMYVSWEASAGSRTTCGGREEAELARGRSKATLQSRNGLCGALKLEWPSPGLQVGERKAFQHSPPQRTQDADCPQGMGVTWTGTASPRENCQQAALPAAGITNSSFLKENMATAVAWHPLQSTCKNERNTATFPLFDFFFIRSRSMKHKFSLAQIISTSPLVKV